MAGVEGKRVAVVGGGIGGLTAALRLAEKGHQVDLYEAAPALGGRTRSFYDRESGEWVDNGPHMMVGAYAATQKLLADVGAGHHVTWQSSLVLPLWEEQRGFFALKAVSWLPVAIALLLGVARMPGHGWSSIKAMVQLALTMKNRSDQQTVAQWLQEINAPDILIRDMLDVLCLGVMNEAMETANAKTFARVLATSFAAHAHARMGWFNKPLSQALIEPLHQQLKLLGVGVHLRHTIRDLKALNHDAVVLALPAFARNRLLGRNEQVATRVITNIHLWFEEEVKLPSMMLGLLGTYSQWLFDVREMMQGQGLPHLCVTISADVSPEGQVDCLDRVTAEIERMLGKKLPDLKHMRFVQEKRATVLVRPLSECPLPAHVFDAGESPYPGQLPATIELAVISAERVALLV